MLSKPAIWEARRAIVHRHKKLKERLDHCDHRALVPTTGPLGSNGHRQSWSVCLIHHARHTRNTSSEHCIHHDVSPPSLPLSSSGTVSSFCHGVFTSTTSWVRFLFLSPQANYSTVQFTAVHVISCVSSRMSQLQTGV